MPGDEKAPDDGSRFHKMKKIDHSNIPNPDNLYQRLLANTYQVNAGDVVWIKLEDPVADIIKHTLWYAIANEMIHRRDDEDFTSEEITSD